MNSFQQSWFHSLFLVLRHFRKFVISDSMAISPFALKRIFERSRSTRSKPYKYEPRIPKSQTCDFEICDANEIFSQRTFSTATTQTLCKLAWFVKLSLMVLVPELCIESLLLEKPVSLSAIFSFSLALFEPLFPPRLLTLLLDKLD